ncbi:hypothetical protein BU15DRAFT_66706 [Melanogaster broomeanus]|nr:hypothetical protein BU15DRAFT_66706 [Melanogaster broomeanus]
MDGLSSATAIIAIIETGASIIVALVKYGVSVKNAKKSCEGLIEEIELINALARAAEESVRKLSTNTAPDTSYQCWIDPKSPVMRYKSELDKFMEKLSQKQDVGRVKGVIQRLGWPAKESEIKAAIESFERYIKHLDVAVTLESSDALNAISKQGKEHGTLLKGAIDRQRQDETCKWLLDSKRYSDWCSSRNAFLRVCGKPGAGKSVLMLSGLQMKLMLDLDPLSLTAYRRQRSRAIRSPTSTDRSTHAFEVIRSLLTQLLWKSKDNWLPLFDDLVDRKSNGSPPPVDLEILYQLLLKAVRLHDRPVLVIDALDECNDYVKLTELLARLHNEGSCRVFCTSRPFPDAPKAFSDLPIIDLHDMGDETLCDMKLHIEKEVAKYDKLTNLRDEIVSSLLKKADGMFRWVQCQLHRLRDCRAKSNIQQVLATLPSGLYETYDKILSDINKKEFDGHIAKSILLWLVGALEPFSLGLLVEAVTFDLQRSETFSGFEFLSNDDVLDVCGSLVSYDEKSDRVSLSHFSVKEYLLDDHLRNGALSQYRLSSPIANNHLAKLCIDYFSTPQMIPRFQIRFSHKRSLESFQRLTPLAMYIGEFGSQHFRRLVETDEPLHELMQSLLTLRNAFRARSKESDMVLNFLASWGSPCFLKTYLEDPQTIRLTDISNGNSPLGYAIAHDNYACAEALLKLGLDINLLCRKRDATMLRDSGFLYPLEAAVSYNRSQIVDLLLSRRCFIPQNIIHLAIISVKIGFRSFLASHPNPVNSIICSLLKYGANATVLTTRGDSLLHAWLREQPYDHLVQHSIAEALVDAGCDPRSKNATGITPLSLALLYQNGALVDYFLGQGALFEDSRYIHLADVRWARRLLWHDAAFAAAHAAKHVVEVAHSITLADVYRVRLMLQKRFKVTSLILGTILDLAEYWACYPAVEGHSGNTDATFKFLRSPHDSRTVKVQRIEFTIVVEAGRRYVMFYLSIQSGNDSRRILRLGSVDIRVYYTSCFGDRYSDALPGNIVGEA